jgi:hypothetical protein
MSGDGYGKETAQAPNANAIITSITICIINTAMIAQVYGQLHSPLVGWYAYTNSIPVSQIR